MIYKLKSLVTILCYKSHIPDALLKPVAVTRKNHSLESEEFYTLLTLSCSSSLSGIIGFIFVFLELGMMGWVTRMLMCLANSGGVKAVQQKENKISRKLFTHPINSLLFPESIE